MPRYVQTTVGEVAETREVVPGEVWADFDKAGKLLGIEVLTELEKHPPIDLHHAWMWDCETCGAENFERCIVKELTTDDSEEIPPEYRDCGFLLSGHPDTVKCQDCGARYTARPTGAVDDEDS